MTICGGQRDAPRNTIPRTNFRRDAGPSTAKNPCKPSAPLKAWCIRDHGNESCVTIKLESTRRSVPLHHHDSMSLWSKGALAMHGSLQQQPCQSLPRYTRILALDLGKFNSVLCNYDPATAGHAFVSLATDRQTIRDRLAEAAGSSDRSSILVVFETCEISGWGRAVVRGV